MKEIKTNYPFSITVVTKVKTPNAGNQAVSAELLRLLKKTYPNVRIYAGWRVPGLEQYSFARLQHAGADPLRTLDTWAESIINKYSSSGKANSPGQEELSQTLQKFEVSSNGSDPACAVELAPDTVSSLPVRLYRKGLRIVKSPFDRLRGYGIGYEPWLKVLEHSNLVLYSPAGDLAGDARADYLVRDLLGLRIAQRLGARVAAVNQSIEVKNPLILRLLGQLYSSFDAVVVRDPVSSQRLADAQVPQEKIKLAPDTAYLARLTPGEERELNQIKAGEEIGSGTVGITAQPRTGFDFSGWGKVIQGLQALGKQVLFLSHEMSSDGRVGIELQKLYGGKVISRQYDYGEYIRVLSSLELVISERYHTCVFSAIAGTPFIPLKIGQMSKMHGIVWFLDYPISPIDTDSAGWADVTQNHIGYIYQNYERITANLNEAMPRLRKLTEQNVLSHISIS